MKECWYKAIEKERPDADQCIRQLAYGGCEKCRYYREDELTENENAKEGDAR